MEQNTIAVIWDFDKTLIPGYMQVPIFNAYNVDEKQFWDETNSLVDIYRDQGIKVNQDTVYLNHMLTCVKQGIFKGLNNKKLREFGKELKFYPGVPEIFKELKDMISKDEKYLEVIKKIIAAVKIADSEHLAENFEEHLNKVLQLNE